MEPLSAQVLQQEGFIHSPRELKGELGKRFEFLSKLGEGSFGIVASVKEKKSGKIVALKKIKIAKKNEGISISALREIGILKSLNHPNIVKIDEVFYDQEISQLCFLLQYHPNNLHEYIKANNPMTLKQIQSFTFQILKSMQYLHLKGIIHRDLKPQNYLISSEKELKLCDFGQAKFTSYKKAEHTPDISTLWYRAPQILMGAALYDEKVDVWAVGCIVTEMILGTPLFMVSNQISLLFAIFKLFGTPKIQNYPEYPSLKDVSPAFPKFLGEGLRIESISSEANDFINKLLVVNPENRFSIEQALHHSFLMGMDENAVV